MTNNTSSNASNSIVNTTAVTIKLVEITGQKPLSHANQNGQQWIGGRGEAGIYARRADKKGVDITREIGQAQLVENLFAGKNGLVMIDPGSKNVEAATHVAFVPVQPNIGDAYSHELHMSSLQNVLAQALKVEVQPSILAKPSDITLRMTAPGSFEGREASEARKGQLEAWLKERGVHVQWLTATADLPEADRFQSTDPVDYGDFMPQVGDLFVNGSRRLRTNRVTEAMHTLGKLLIQGREAQRLIVPLTIGANLALAESAVQAGIPVVFAYIGSRPETWVDATRERLNAVMASGNAVIVGNTAHEYTDGLFSASIEAMAQRVVSSNGEVALLTEPNSRGEGKRLAELPGVVDFWPHVKGYLDAKLGAEVVSQELADKQELVAAAQAQKAQFDEIPF